MCFNQENIDFLKKQKTLKELVALGSKEVVSQQNKNKENHQEKGNGKKQT